jgi:carboxyl-terminal processing protease
MQKVLFVLMRTIFCFLLACFGREEGLIAQIARQPPEQSSQQALQQTVQDAFLISRMVEKFHVQPRPLDQSMSSAIYADVLGDLDEERIFFTKSDIDKLSAYRYKLDDEIRNKQSAYLQLLIGIYKQRLLQTDTMIDHITAKPFNFSIRDKLTVAEDTAQPADEGAVHAKLYKLLKSSVLSGITGYAILGGTTPTKKYVDSLEPILRKKAATRAKRSIKRILQSPMGVDYMIGTIFCQSLASTYDPHTAYFRPEMKTAFESELGNAPLSFGLSLNEDDDGKPQIGRLKPGGPAFQSGALNEGDKIQSIQWDNKEPIDVSNAELQEIGEMLATSGGNKVTLTVKKADGTVRQVVLHKEKLNTDEDEDKVKGFLLKGARTMGYISLPAFYSDWENSKGVNGCANDVAKEIIKLKKENIEGLILDLRYNGGGSVEEAIELSGIFIDAGPVALVKTKDAKVITLKDVNRGTIYDGPMILLVNGLSASASEMVAGTLQDYHRALIVGSPTYGKATAQVVLPMDTTVNPDLYDGHGQASSYIKLTTSKLYRITGASAQVSGVQPDISLPDPPDAVQQREADEKAALAPTTIAANKYYIPLPVLPVAAAAAMAKKEMDSSDYFKEARKATMIARVVLQKDISLFLDDSWQERKKEEEESGEGSRGESGEGGRGESGEDSTDGGEKNKVFIVANHAYEQKRIDADHDLRETNDERRSNLLNDPYIKLAYSLLTVMGK